jgi:hypothetical protein
VDLAGQSDQITVAQIDLVEARAAQRNELRAEALDDALARGDRIVNAIKATVAGRVRGKRWSREQTPRKLKFGEEVALVFTLSRPVPYADDIFAAAYALAPVPPLSPANPDEPNGPTGNEFFTTPITLANGRPS